MALKLQGDPKKEVKSVVSLRLLATNVQIQINPEYYCINIDQPTRCVYYADWSLYFKVKFEK